MRVLWITNIILPEAESFLKGTTVSLQGSGGWLISSARQLCENKAVELAIASVYVGVRELKAFRSESRIQYFVIPYGKGNMDYNSEYDKYWVRVIEAYKPDIIHIHGTEFSHGLSCLNVCHPIPVVISMQGVVCEIAANYLGGMSNLQIFQNITLYDMLHRTLWQQKKVMLRRAMIERDLLKKVKYVIGRTSFDHNAVVSINPDIKYFTCNESLRDVFYEEPHWEYGNCKPHSIFYSQSRSPLKGLHVLLSALPYIRHHFPDVKVRIAGDNMLTTPSLYAMFHKTGYARFLESIIKRHDLKEIVEFTGNLSDKGMKEEYLNSNVFVCASSNENSSNSISEAQLLGVPVVASAVGGNLDMIPEADLGCLFTFPNEKELSDRICEIFNNSRTFKNKTMITKAKTRHDRMNNNNQLMKIYDSILSGFYVNK